MAAEISLGSSKSLRVKKCSFGRAAFALHDFLKFPSAVSHGQIFLNLKTVATQITCRIFVTLAMILSLPTKGLRSIFMKQPCPLDTEHGTGQQEPSYRLSPASP